MGRSAYLPEASANLDDPHAHGLHHRLGAVAGLQLLEDRLKLLGRGVAIDDLIPHVPDEPVAAAANIRAPYAGETGQRNNYRGDGYMSLDSGLSKSFKTFEGQSLKISVEGFNVLNSVRFNDGSSTTMVTNGFSSSYGTYSALLTQPRQMQFSGRYYF